MQAYVFLDLDDTLFQTLPKCPPDEARRPTAFRKDGAPLSYMTRRQEKFFELLGGVGAIIPVTARNLDAFRRVDLPFRSLAILDFGGVVLLPGGALDAAWDARIRPQTLAAGAALARLGAAAEAFIVGHHLGVRVRVIADFDMPLYLVMKHPAGDVAMLERIAAEHLPTQPLDEFFVHANGNNLSIVPRFLGKEHAVRYVLDRHVGGAVLSIGVGDSVSDVPFLSLCDFMMTPRGTQLAGAVGSCVELK